MGRVFCGRGGGLCVLLFFEIWFLCPGTCSAEQANLEYRDPPVSISRMLGLKACTTTALLGGSGFEYRNQEKHPEGRIGLLKAVFSPSQAGQGVTSRSTH